MRPPDTPPGYVTEKPSNATITVVVGVLTFAILAPVGSALGGDYTALVDRALAAHAPSRAWQIVTLAFCLLSVLAASKLVLAPDAVIAVYQSIALFVAARRLAFVSYAVGCAYGPLWAMRLQLFITQLFSVALMLVAETTYGAPASVWLLAFGLALVANWLASWTTAVAYREGALVRVSPRRLKK
jgi:hypothetical protein